MSLDPTEEWYQTLQIILHQDLFSMIHDKKKLNKKHQTHSGFHSKDFSESHIWPTTVLLLIICVREMMQESQSLGPYPIILTY